METFEQVLAAVDMTEPCWRWTKGHTTDRRPEVWFRDRMWYVYRLLFTEFREPIPPKMTLDHVFCDQGWCCNPWHCEIKSNRDNVRRALEVRYAGRTACPQGHPYALYRRYRKTGKDAGKAYCVKCGTIRSRAWQRENKPWRRSRAE